MGGMLADKKEEKEKISKNLILVLVFGVLYAIEEFILAYFNFNIKGVDTVIFLVPFSYFLFKLILSINVNLSDDLCSNFRKYSILMFLTQRIPLSIIDLFLQGTFIAQNSLILFLIVLASTIAISYLIIALSKKIKFMKKLY